MKNKIIVRTLICLLAVAMLLTACGDPGATTTAGGQASVPTTTGTVPPDPTTAPTLPTSGPVEPQPPVVEQGYRVTYENNAAVTLQGNLMLGERVEAGTQISFTVTVSALYEGTPVVKVGNRELQADAQGMYSFTVEADTALTVEGLRLKTSEMEGAGTSLDDPFLITSPVDMLYIAQQVNKGNANYTNAFYSLQNDLDFEGLEMEIIGDGNTDAAVFAGYFNGNGYTISNYRIVSDSAQYVGLFGVLQADLRGTGGGTIYNLRLADFTVDAAMDAKAMFVGGMVGYGMGANLYLCSAQGTLNVYADSNNFAYAGGLMGIQQALDYQNYPYYSSISYCDADVDVNCNSGQTYAAGGLVGYACASNMGVVSYLNNSYASGNIYGAMCAGGLVGYLAGDTSLTTCYATGVASAQTNGTDLVNSEAFCYAYAGGLVGYADVNVVVSESYSLSPVSATATLGSAYAVTDGLLAGKAEVGQFDYNDAPAVVYNCLYAADGGQELTDGTYLTETMHWNRLDWKFVPGQQPTVNTEDNGEFFFTVTISIDGQTHQFERDVYVPLDFWYDDQEGGLPSRLLAAEGSTRMSCGYYFDEACTMPVHDSFVPTHDITLYAAVADVADVAGEYELQLPGCTDSIRLTLNTDGTFTYADAGETAMSGYSYNGETVIFEQARLGRFAADADLNHYQFYTFCGYVQDDGSLRIVGGEYTTDSVYRLTNLIYSEDAPLVAVPVEAAAERSVFAGTWSIDSKAHKEFTFDGAGNWSYTYYGYKTSGTKSIHEHKVGTYTVSDAVLTLSGDLSGTATIADGALLVTLDGATVSYHRENSFYGAWIYPDYGMTLYLNGIRADGQGSARVEYLYENGTVEAYDLTYAVDERNTNRICLYYQEDEYSQPEAFGYLRYLPYADRLNATIYVGSLGTFMSNVNMGGMDDYLGQWIGKTAGMETLEFDGRGAYDGGLLTVGETTVSYMLNDSTLSGSFRYDGKVYFLSYNEADDTVTLTCGDTSATYCRKDALRDITLTDGAENFYTFDGRTTLGAQGNMFCNGEAAYTYTLSADGNVTLYSAGKQVGTLTATETDYVLAISGGETTNLRIYSFFTGTWALSGSPEANLVIGTMGLDGKLPGKANGNDVVFTMEQGGYLSFTLKNSNTLFYVIRVGEDLVVDGCLDWYLYDTRVEGARIDDMYGTWKNSLGAAYQFDGMSNATLTTALAQGGSISGTTFTGSTAFAYSVNDQGQFILWTTDSTTKRTVIYRLNFCDVSTRRAYINADGTLAFTVEKGNELYMMDALDEDSGIRYRFDGFDKVTDSNGDTYSYTFGTIDYETGIVTANITIDGELWVATIDFSVAQPTIVLEKE